MKRSRFSEEQIIAILKEQENGLPTKDVCRRHGISTATFYKWKAKYGGLDVSDARKLKALEEAFSGADARQRYPQGHQLKKVVTPDTKREAVAHACSEHGVSQRRACDVLAIDRFTVRYNNIRPDDADLRKAI